MKRASSLGVLNVADKAASDHYQVRSQNPSVPTRVQKNLEGSTCCNPSGDGGGGTVMEKVKAESLQCKVCFYKRTNTWTTLTYEEQSIKCFTYSDQIFRTCQTQTFIYDLIHPEVFKELSSAALRPVAPLSFFSSVFNDLSSSHLSLIKLN